MIVSPLRSLSKLVIAMINGHAHGAGFNLALGYELRVMAETATLRIPFVERGIATGTNLQFVGIGKAMEWPLLAPTLSAQETERWGLVTRVVPLAQLEVATSDIARHLAQGPTLIFGYTESAIARGWEISPEAAYEYQGQALSSAQQTEDYPEGRRAFAEKRLPQFRGR